MSAKAKIFFSYKRNHPETTAVLEPVKVALEEAGYEVLIDRDIEGGEEWEQKLADWMFECAGAVIFASRAAMEDSEWCGREWSALSLWSRYRDIPLIPILIDLSPTELHLFSRLQCLQKSDTNLLSALLLRLTKTTPCYKIHPEDYITLHHQWLNYLYHRAPVLGCEPFSLADTYMEAECGILKWGKIREQKLDPDAESESTGGRKSCSETVLSLFADCSLREPIVVRGPAGAGKTSFCLHLADRLLSEGLAPIFIRFRNLTYHGQNDLWRLLSQPNTLRVGHANHSAPEPSRPVIDDILLREKVIFKGTTICRYIFIFDGWDEVSLGTSEGYKSKLQNILSLIRTQLFGSSRVGPPVRVILTGRPSIEVKESGLLRDETPILSLRPVSPSSLQMFSDTLVDKLGLNRRKANIVIAQYDEWCKNLKRESLRNLEVLGLPLLALLAFRALASDRVAPSQILQSSSALYQELIDQTVQHAGKGQKELLSPAAHVGGVELRLLLQRTASMITVTGEESINFEELDRRLRNDPALGNWEEKLRQATDTHPLHALVINFYFKGGDTEFGCEFLHKTFREYLYAEAVVTTLESVLDTCKDAHPIPAPRIGICSFDSREHPYHSHLCRELTLLLSPQWMTWEVRNHIFWLLESKIDSMPQRWLPMRDLLADIYAWWAEGAHLRKLPSVGSENVWEVAKVDALQDWSMSKDTVAVYQCASTTTLDSQLGDALIQITAFVHARLLDFPSDSPTQRFHQSQGIDSICRFRPGGHQSELSTIFSRIASTPFRPLGPKCNHIWLGHACLVLEAITGESLEFSNLSGTDLTESFLRGSNFQEAELFRAVLNKADLEGAILRKADLRLSSLVESTLRRADLADAKLHGANLSAADLRYAIVDNAILWGSTLKNANLDYSSAAGADLCGAIMWGASLKRAYLRKALFRNTDVQNSNLQHAELSCADLFGADLENSDLRCAKLSRTNLRSANLCGCDLSEVDLSGADLTNAKCDERTNFTKANLEGTIGLELP